MNIPMRKATHARHYTEAPQLVDPDGSRHWVTRAANFVAVVTDAQKGASFDRSNNPDEYMLLLPQDPEALVEAGGERITAKENSLTIVPPGKSSVTIQKPGTVVRIFSNRAADVMAMAANGAIYADGASEGKRLSLRGPTRWRISSPTLCH